MIRSILFTPDNQQIKDLSPQAITEALKNPDNLVWVILNSPSETEVEIILRSTFHFHPLSIEDCLTTSYQTPKIDDFNNYLFLIMHALQQNDDLGSLGTMECDFFLGSNFLVVSYLEPNMPPVEFIWNRLERDHRLYINGSDFLCHAILDAMVDEFMPLLDRMDDEIEYLEDKVVEKPAPEILERILNLKHMVMQLRRVVSPQREVVNRLSRDDFPMIDQQSRIYFRDIYDHLVRIQDLSDTIRDIVSGALDIYLNSTSLRLNEIMKALTIVSTIFLPLSFVAGVYGMNFQYFPEITWQLGYLFVWCIFISIAIGMIIFFKKRGWF
jgi:magnesium transporter